MTSPRERRILKELAEMAADRESGIEATPVTEDDLTNLVGTFPGPADTAYAGAKYSLKIKIPVRYPFQPPEISFITRVWHPNVSSVTGAICLDTLSSGWSPVQTIKVAILSCQALLESPEPKDPQDALVAKQMLDDPAAFLKQARSWAVQYAGASSAESDAILGPLIGSIAPAKDRTNAAFYQGYSKQMTDKFLEMGFDINDVVRAFRACGIPPNEGQPHMRPMSGWEDMVMLRLLGD